MTSALINLAVVFLPLIAMFLAILLVDGWQ